MAAAPRVDQAIITGIRYTRDNTMLVTAIPIPNAHNQEAVCSGVADRLRAAWKINATDPVNPTNVATNPATTAETVKSLNIRPRRVHHRNYPGKPGPREPVRRGNFKAAKIA
jgi:hypothetical protein